MKSQKASLSFLIYLAIVWSAWSCSVKPKSNLNETSSQSRLMPLTQKTGEFEECGVRGLKTGTSGTICGFNYQVLASPLCPEDYFVSRADMSCPGSKRVMYKIDATCDGNPDFEYDHTKRCVGSFRDCEGAPAPTKYYRCYRNDLQTCAKREFGVVYKACEHPSHPIIGEKSCSHESFGKIFNSCSLLLTRQELALWLEDRAILIELTKSHLLAHQANYYASTSDEQNFSCLITKFSGDTLYADIVADLKTRYFTSFGVEYDASRFNCASGIDERTIENARCSENDNSLKCKTLKAYKLAKSTIDVTATDLKNLQNDVTVKAPDAQEFRDQILELQKLIQGL